jgi:hypothetical protein
MLFQVVSQLTDEPNSMVTAQPVISAVFVREVNQCHQEQYDMLVP